jgi:hypothetical protein
MRDFRNAKAMAQTLRAALATKGVKITIGQSLELIAEIFGQADWNTLAAAIRAEKSISREKVSPPLPAVGSSFPPLSSALALTLHRAFGFASQRKHEYATLEHLLLALIDDADALAVLRVCSADLGALAEKLVGYLDNELKTLVIDNGADSKPTAAFQAPLAEVCVAFIASTACPGDEPCRPALRERARSCRGPRCPTIPWGPLLCRPIGSRAAPPLGSAGKPARC